MKTKTLSLPQEQPVFPLNWVVTTNNAIAPLILRLMLALVVFPHGAQKVLGWFGGYGFEGTMGFFTDTLHLPYIVGLSVILIEFITPFLLVAGLFTRVAATLLTFLFIGIVLTSHIQYGFFMNWFGTQAGEGYEFHLLVLGITAALLVAGGGRYSVDRQLA